jgi:hypothetical protein
MDQKCHSLQPIMGDVLDYSPPSGPIVCFMCNPFDETTLRAVLKSWRMRYQSGEREIRILYLNMRNNWLTPVARNSRFVVLAPNGPM